MGAPIRRKAPEKIVGRAPPLFGSKSTISHFGERFRDGQYSLVSFLFAVLLTVPRAQLFVKVGARAPVPHGVGATGGTVPLGLAPVCGPRCCSHRPPWPIVFL